MIGYGSGALGYAAAANLFFVFFLFFLTTVAGFNPAIGGIIILISVLWDGITDPLVGYLSDNSRMKHGKRRPFILIGTIPVAVTTVLMFTDVSFVTGTAKQIYFIGLNMLFWLFFTTVDIPWATLGSELTEDYNEKTKIRTVSVVFLQVGVLLEMVATPLLIARGTQKYGTEAAGWTYMASLCGAFILATYLISWNFTRGKEPLERPKEEKQGKKFILIKQIGTALKNRSMRYLLGATFTLIAALSGILPAFLMFLLKFNLGFENEVDQSLYLGIFSVSAIAFTPLAGWVSTRFSKSLGKAKTLGYFGTITGALLVSGKIIGITPAMMVVLLVTTGLGQAAFFVFIYVLAYDVAAVLAYKTGRNMDALVVSVMSFFLKLGMATGIGLSGVMLSAVGFNESAAVQTPSALAGIETCFCVFGGLVVLLGTIFCFKFPITQQKYDALKEAAEKKSTGEMYSEASFADIL